MTLEEIMSGELQYLEFKRDIPEKSENKSSAPSGQKLYCQC